MKAFFYGMVLFLMCLSVLILLEKAERRYLKCTSMIEIPLGACSRLFGEGKQ